MKTQNLRELQQIAINHSPDINFKDFTNTFLVNDLTLPSDNHLRFIKRLLKINL